MVSVQPRASEQDPHESVWLDPEASGFREPDKKARAFDDRTQWHQVHHRIGDSLIRFWIWCGDRVARASAALRSVFPQTTPATQPWPWLAVASPMAVVA